MAHARAAVSAPKHGSGVTSRGGTARGSGRCGPERAPNLGRRVATSVHHIPDGFLHAGSGRSVQSRVSRFSDGHLPARIWKKLYQAAGTLTYAVMTGHRAGHLSPHMLNEMTGSVVQPETLVTLRPATWVTVFLLCSSFTGPRASKGGTSAAGAADHGPRPTISLRDVI
jgi:hypothetical protein